MADVDPLALLQPAATLVRDPVSGRSVWLAGMVQRARVEDGVLHFDLHVGEGHSAPDRRLMIEAIVRNLREQGHAGEVRPALVERRASAAPRGAPVQGMDGPGIAPHGGPIRKQPLPGVAHVVAVASGKGGVGKSTVATNLAVGLRRLGLRTGLLDADIYGPSLPTMMNLSSRPMLGTDGKAVPPESYGVKCLSMGMLVDPGEAMIWRGPMVMDVVRKFLQDTAWGPLDVLFIDLPPGTGDAQLTLVQAVSLDGAVIVTTPQEVALADAVRGIRMFRKLDVPLLGLVENMAWYELPDGTRDPVFGTEGGLRTALRFQTDLLGQIPLQSAIRKGGDDGLPVVLGDTPSGLAFRDLADAVVARLGLELPA